MLSLSRNRATGNFFDITGERIFIMGSEKTGIGEIWVPPFRVLSSLRWGVKMDDTIRWSYDYPVHFSSFPEKVVREVEIPGWKVKEEITCSRAKPSGLSRITVTPIQGQSPGTLEMPPGLVVKAVVDFRLMWPYPSSTVTVQDARWRPDLKAVEFRDGRNLFWAYLGSAPGLSQDHWSLTRSRTGWEATLTLDLKDRKTPGVTVIVAASDRSQAEAVESHERMARNPGKTLVEQKTYHNDQLSRCLTIESPDLKFNRGYGWALVGIDRHFLHTPGLGKGYAAGFAETTPGWGESRPGYAWYFGRDSVWTSLAALTCGEFEKVRDNLKLLGDFQDISGKIFHELTLSGVVHHDSADSTPLYIVLMGEYLRWSGDTPFVESQWNRVEKSMTFLRSTIHNEFHLIENRNVGHGWVEFGPLAGSDAEMYLTACWAEALRQTAYMARIMNRPKVVKECESEFRTVTANLESLFWNHATGTYDLGLRFGTSNKTEKTVLPAVAVLFDLLPFDRSRRVASLFSEKAFSTPWGVRIQSADSPSYKGSGYHTGSVWPLFTGWSSLAEYRTHLHREGFTHIMATLSNFKKGALGWVEEVINGETGRPAGVCQHQAWSEAMVCLPITRGMLGLKADAFNSRLTIAPHIPPDWNRLTVSGIRFGKKRVSFSFEKKNGNNEFRFDVTGNGPVALEFEPWISSDHDAIRARVNGQTTRFPVHRFGGCPHPNLSITLEGSTTITFLTE